MDSSRLKELLFVRESFANLTVDLRFKVNQLKRATAIKIHELITIQLDEIDSTNEFLKRALSEQDECSIAAFANFQKKGKGQANRTWHSKECQNVLMSLGIKWKEGNIEARHLPVMSMHIALMLRLFISDLIGSDDVLLKWPNDVLVRNKKIAGILIETVLHNQRLKQLIVGVGLNLNQNEFPSQLKNATSASLFTGTSYEVVEVGKQLAKKLKEGVLIFEKLDLEAIVKSYNERLGLFGSKIKYTEKGSTDSKEAKFLGVDSEGCMCLEIKGEEKKLLPGSIRIII